MGMRTGRLTAIISFLSISLTISLPLGAKDIVVQKGQALMLATMDMPEFGLETRKAIELAVDEFGGEILGHRIKLHHYGQGCDARNEKDGFLNGLIREPKTLGLIGPMCSGRTARIVELLSDAEVLTISPSNTAAFFSDPDFHTEIPYYFRTSPNDRVQGIVDANFSLAQPSDNGLGATTAAIVHYEGDDFYSTTLAQGFSEAFTANGGTISGQFSIDFDSTDFGELIGQIGEVDVVFTPIFVDNFIPFYEQFRAVQSTTPLLATDGIAGFPLSEIFGEDPVATYFSNVLANGPLLESFRSNFMERYGYEPNPYDAFAYDATLLLLSRAAGVAVDNGSGTLTIASDALLAAMNDSENYPFAGAGATYQAPVNGDLNMEGWAVFQEVMGEFIPLFP